MNGERRISHERLVALRQRKQAAGSRLGELPVGTRWQCGGTKGVVLGPGHQGGVLVSVRDCQGGRDQSSCEWSSLVRVQLKGLGVLQERSA